VSNATFETVRTVVIKGHGRHRKATCAAAAWALASVSKWWESASQRYGRPDGYDRYNVHHEKAYRRALPIFQKVLP